MKKYSMTRRIVLLVLLIELLAASTTVALVFFYQRHTYFGALDIALQGRADSLLGAVVEASDNSDSVLLEASDIRTPSIDLYEVWEKDTLLVDREILARGTPNCATGQPGI